MKKLLFIVMTSFLGQVSNAQTDSIDYFGQTPPGNKAVKFAPEIVSLPNSMEGSIAFTPDGNECYFSVFEFIDGNLFSKIFYKKRINNTWTKTEEASFSIGQNVWLSSLSSDGNRLFFEKDNDIWKVERTTGGWGEPQPLPAPINLNSTESGYTETTDGIIYISSNRPGGFGQYYDIWCIRPSSVQAENLGPIVNSNIAQGYPCIAPDGSYLIFSQIISERPYLVISFNKGNNAWTVPIDMDRSGADINILNQDSPTLSPDGKYLFFRPHTGYPYTNISDIYWVSTHILDTLKKVAFAPKLNKQIPNMNIKTDSVVNYVIPSNTFTCEYGTDSLKYTATLSNGSVLPSWLHFNSDIRTLSGAPKQAEIDTIRITATNKDTVSVSCSFRITVTASTGIFEKSSQLPKESQLQQNYPNPFNPSTTIKYSLAKSSHIKLTIYNVLGQKIKTLADCFQNAGEHSIVWDATDEKNNPVSAGVYYYRFEAGNMNLQKRMALLK